MRSDCQEAAIPPADRVRLALLRPLPSFLTMISANNPLVPRRMLILDFIGQFSDANVLAISIPRILNSEGFETESFV